MESLEFSEDEIKRQLAALGYFSISEDRMQQFRKDLHKLIEHDRSASGSSSWYTGVSSPSSTSDTSETSDKMKKTNRPALSRFQPHIKVPSKPESLSRSSGRGDSLWMTQSEISEVPLHLHPRTGPYNQPVPRHSDSASTVGGMRSLSIDDEGNRREPLQQIQNMSLQPSASYHHSSNFETTSVTEDYSSDSDQSSTTSTATETKVIRKRKVLRKELDGTPRVYDESLVEDATRGLHRIHDVSIDDTDPRLSRAAPRHQLPPRPHSTKPNWRDEASRESLSSSDQPPSYIRSNLNHPHTRNLKKTDPVNRYRQYKDFWTNLKAPGEKSHKELRWEVKAQMMYKEEPAPRPQRVFVPNTYVVPTSKKRSALRWEVRHAMEHGLPLPTSYDVY